MLTPADRTVTDLDLTAWTVSTREAKPGALAPHLEIVLFTSEKGRRWAPIVRGGLHLYSPRDLRGLLEQARPLPDRSSPATQ